MMRKQWLLQGCSLLLGHCSGVPAKEEEFIQVMPN